MSCSNSDIVLLQIERVLISEDKSTSRHCAFCMSNVDLARLHLFRALGALAGVPTHHLKHADSEVRPVVDNTVCWECYHWRYCVPFVSVSRRRSAVSLTRSFLMRFLERFYHPCICVTQWVPTYHPSSFIISSPTNFIHRLLQLVTWL